MTLDEIVIQRTKGLAAHGTPKEKLHFLMTGKNRFMLPMATAILSVLYPDDFTIYDYRVCEELKYTLNLGNITKFENLWEGYLKYKVCLKTTLRKGCH